MTLTPIEPEQSRLIPIQGVINFRDLGGYQTRSGQQVRWGKAYRSAQLDRLTTQGIAQLQALNIKTVVDLRFSEETLMYPTLRAAVPQAQMLSWHDEQDSQHSNLIRDKAAKVMGGWRDSLDSNDPELVREAMRMNYPQKLYSHAMIYRRMLHALIDEQSPIVFHCAAGKDRTGVAAALILGLLGVDDQTIIEDYLVTQSQMGELVESWLAGGATDREHYADFQKRLIDLPRELVQPVFEADPSYIETLLDYVESQYQGFVNYAERVLNITPDQIDALRRHMLVDG